MRLCHLARRHLSLPLLQVERVRVPWWSVRGRGAGQQQRVLQAWRHSHVAHRLSCRPPVFRSMVCFFDRTPAIFFLNTFFFGAIFSVSLMLCSQAAFLPHLDCIVRMQPQNAKADAGGILHENNENRGRVCVLRSRLSDATPARHVSVRNVKFCSQIRREFSLCDRGSFSSRLLSLQQVGAPYPLCSLLRFELNTFRPRSCFLPRHSSARYPVRSRDVEGQVQLF